MKVLKDLIKRSNYIPSGGLKMELYNLVSNDNYDSIEIKERFSKKNQLRSVNRHLKESLLSSILTMPLYGIDKSVRNRIRLFRKRLEARILLYIGSRVVGTKVAIDTIVVAEKIQDFETVHILCKELINQFSNSQPNTIKYKKYRAKMDTIEKFMQNELLAEKTYRDLVHCKNIKVSVNHFKGIIEKLDSINNINHKFNFFLYSTKSVYYQLTNDIPKLIENNKAAYSFFNSLDLGLHYITKFNFLSDLIPYYISTYHYRQAESIINRCLELTPKGYFNWHQILLHKAILGFYSEKPRMALNAYKTAHALRKKFNNKKVIEKWHLIHGYLELYKKLDRGKIVKNEYEKSFKLSKYLNIDEEKRNDEQKANLIIIELFHLLIDEKHSQYFEKIEKIESYIETRFRAHKFKRTRYFLRLLKSVIKGNYRASLVKAHAKRQLKNLADSRKDLGIETIDLEIVPYEILWELLLKIISKK